MAASHYFGMLPFIMYTLMLYNPNPDLNVDIFFPPVLKDGTTMFDFFKSQFKTIDTSVPNIKLREPSGILINLIVNRQKLFEVDDVGSLPRAVHRTLYVLACLYCDDESLCLRFYNTWAKQIGYEPQFTSVEYLYKDLDDEAFTKFIFACTTLMPTTKLDEWYNIIDKEFYFTEKTKSELKNE